MSARRRVRLADRPAVTRAEVEAAIAAIADRHVRAEAAYAEEISSDPTEMLVHLRKRSIDFPADLRRMDYPDAVVLARWVAQHEAERITLWALEQGKRLGFTNREVGHPYGLLSRQGVPDKIKALRLRLQGAGAEAEAASRPAPAAAPGRPLTPAERELAWLDANRKRILGVAHELLSYTDLADEDAADWLAEVGRDVADGACTPASFVVIGCAVDDLAASPAVTDLDPGHALLTLMGEWRSLFAEHRNVSREPRATGTAEA
jgi:hypothetical protein